MIEKINGMDSYWWQKEAKVIASYLDQMRASWQTEGSNPIYTAWVRNMVSYYSAILEPTAWDTQLAYAGEQGELVKMIVPQARSLIRQLVSLVTKQPLSFNVSAESKDSDVVADARLGNALLKSIVKESNLNITFDRVAEQAAVFGMGFTHTAWRTDRGDQYAALGDALLYSGKIDISARSVFDLTYDSNIEKWEDQDWCEVKTIKNRWTMLAQFPQLSDEIKSLPSIKRASTTWTYEQSSYTQDDLIYVFEAYHRPTPALPKGRMVVFSSPTCIFYDGDNLYGTIPIEPMIPEAVYGMQYGYPFFTNLLGCQEMMDHSFSAIASNQSAFAVQNIIAPRGSGLTLQDVGGMNWISYTPQNIPNGGKPESLQLCHSSPETFKFIDALRSHMVEISNISGAFRGNLPPGVTSGTAIATLTANSLEFISSFSKAGLMCMNRTMDTALLVSKKFVKTPHEITTTNKKGVASTQEYTSEDLQKLKNVTVQEVNPMMQTLAGRSDIAEKLMSQGLIKNLQEYFSVLEGAPIQELYETELSENDLIHSENENLTEGKPVVAIMTDDHPNHVRKHSTLLNDPSVRLNNDKVDQILQHILEHLNLDKNGDPYLKAMVRTGKAPEMMAPPPMAPPPQEQSQDKKEAQGQALGKEPAANQAAPANPSDDLLGRQ
jgi:hypothetical protein